MGWSIGYDEKNKRDIGYGVPAICDHPECNKEINRGLSYVCGGEPSGGDCGCGLHFCWYHLSAGSLCERCELDQQPFEGKPDCKEWAEFKLTDESWQEWRNGNPDCVKALEAIVKGGDQ